MNAKILRIQPPRRKRETAALADVLAELRALRRSVERLEQTAPTLVWWESRDE